MAAGYDDNHDGDSFLFADLRRKKIVIVIIINPGKRFLGNIFIPAELVSTAIFYLSVLVLAARVQSSPDATHVFYRSDLLIENV